MRSTPFLLGLLLATAARSQTLEQLRDQFREATKKGRYTALLSGFLDVTDSQEIAAGHLRVDDVPSLHVDTLKLPYAHNVSLGENEPELHFEASLGAFEAHAEMADLWQGALPGLETGLHSRWFGVSGMLAAGPRFDLGGGVHFTPMLDGSLAYLENDAVYSGPGAAVTEGLLDGILFQWHATDVAYGGALRLAYDRKLGESLWLHSLARFDARRFEGIDATDSTQREGSSVERFTLRSELAGPTGWTVADQGVDWSVHAVYSRFVGPEADALGFVDCIEVGAGISCALPRDEVWFSKLSLSGGLLFGDDVFGWNLGLSVAF